MNKDWILSNNENGNIVIQKNDESDRFKNDNEAAMFVANMFIKLQIASKDIIKSEQCKMGISAKKLRVQILNDILDEIKGEVDYV